MKKIIAIAIIGILLLTVLASLSVVGIKTINNKKNTETGDIGAYVHNRYTVITDANVYCKDINGDIHDMPYGEYKRGIFANIAYDVPEGKCEITASKEGYKTTTISAEVPPNMFRVCYIFIEKKSRSNPMILNFIDLFPNAYLLLRLLQQL